MFRKPLLWKNAPDVLKLILSRSDRISMKATAPKEKPSITAWTLLLNSTVMPVSVPDPTSPFVSENPEPTELVNSVRNGDNAHKPQARAIN